MIKTTRGLPNSCSQCGDEITEKVWYAENEDAARSGQGYCEKHKAGPSGGSDKNGGVEDDLETIDGIGPTTAKLLNGQGITTYLELAEADSAAVAKLVKKPVDIVLEWQTEAASKL